MKQEDINLPALIIMSNDNEEIILRTYSSVWKIDRKIYSIEGLKLLFPIIVNELPYWGASILITFLLIKVVPFFGKLHFVIKYILVPYGLMKFFTSIKLDGKLPHKFMCDYLIFMLNPKQYNRFQPVENIQNVKFNTPILFRRMKIINVTQLAIKSKPKRKGDEVIV